MKHIALILLAGLLSSCALVEGMKEPATPVPAGTTETASSPGDINTPTESPEQTAAQTLAPLQEKASMGPRGGGHGR
ncbi:MAG: hypothetical protein SFW66_00645 [Gammaproteobacteria bacterium]|nr:hypothetical protein [Gammaproteobacteria bacterium]